MTTTSIPRPLLGLLVLLVAFTGTGAAFSIAAFRAVRAERSTGVVDVDSPAELESAIRSATTRPWNADQHGEQTSSAPLPAPTTTPPRSATPTTLTQTVQSSSATPAGPIDLTLGRDATTPSASWGKAAILETRNDPAYGLDVTRMTSAEGTRFNRNTYSRRQAENADGSAFMTYHGDATYNVYDATTAELIAVTPVHPDGDPQWHPTNPDKIRHVAGRNSSAGTLELLESTVSTGRTVVLADLTDRVREIFPTALYMSDRSEGSPSSDGNRYAWIVYNARENPVGIISYDVATDRIAGSVPVDPGVEYRLDWVSASPSGQFVMGGFWEGTYAWDFDMTNERLIFEGGEHSDIALGPTGNDTYVYIDFTSSRNGGWIVAVDLVTGETKRYVDLYDDTNTSIHFSGKAYDRPGWVVASTYNCKAAGGWACEKVFALDLASGTIVNLAHTYNCGADYWTETHAVANRDLTRVYFNSDAGTCGTDAEVYKIDVPNLDLATG